MSCSALSELRAGIVIPGGRRYLIGFSGGADSTALLIMLAPEIRNGRLQAEAIHVNHGLRGAESDGDERFAADLCSREGIPLRVYRADTGGRRDEAAAREARFACFRQGLMDAEADTVILAHHADDQAETFLIRLLRGAGTEGLGGMKREQETDGLRLLRPMLSLRREIIRAALRADGISWREDSSNADPSFLRNRVRLELLPLMEKISPGAAERVSRAAALAAEDSDALNTEALALFSTAAKGESLLTHELMNAPEAVQSRVLRQWWKENSPRRKERELSAAQTGRLLELLKNGRGKVNLPGNTHAVGAQGRLILSRAKSEPPEPVPVRGTETPFLGCCLTAGPSEGDPGDGRLAQEVPAGFTEDCVLRTRRPGDRIRPFGSAGSRKLQDYLTDRKIPEPFRDRIPLLCRGQEVLLVCGVGAGCVPEWRKDQPSVRLTWHGNMPWIKETEQNRKGNEHGSERSNLPGPGTDPGHQGRD